MTDPRHNWHLWHPDGIGLALLDGQIEPWNEPIPPPRTIYPDPPAAQLGQLPSAAMIRRKLTREAARLMDSPAEILWCAWPVSAGAVPPMAELIDTAAGDLGRLTFQARRLGRQIGAARFVLIDDAAELPGWEWHDGALLIATVPAYLPTRMPPHRDLLTCSET